ncbi:MAG: ABC transporter ATP-binding protein [Actinobacteria bacterium]|nr:ABC transporter ATP-binding protein [Actinomycetota bacterium]
MNGAGIVDAQPPVPPDVTDAGAIVVGRHVSKRWRSTPVLIDADITIGPGVTGLLGPNGAGKTTLIGMILGLHRPDEGSLTVLGLEPATAGHQVRARVGYSPEHHRIPPDTRVADFVAHIAQVHGLPRRAAVNRASDALWHVGLGEERFRPLGTMSTGQRQRAKLAQAIVHDPSLVLLDEPTDGLDPLQRDDMLDLIRRMGTEFGMHVVLSSHLLEEVERVCDSVVILRDGRVAASGPIDEVRGVGTGVVVELVDGHDPVGAALLARGFRVERDGVRLVVQSPQHDADPDAAFDAVRDAVAAGRFAIRSLKARRTSLEDVFLADEAEVHA